MKVMAMMDVVMSAAGPSTIITAKWVAACLGRSWCVWWTWLYSGEPRSHRRFFTFSQVALDHTKARIARCAHFRPTCGLYGIIFPFVLKVSLFISRISACHAFRAVAGRASCRSRRLSCHFPCVSLLAAIVGQLNQNLYMNFQQSSLAAKLPVIAHYCVRQYCSNCWPSTAGLRPLFVTK